MNAWFFVDESNLFSMKLEFELQALTSCYAPW